jgi:hypothetical protein
MKNAKFKIFILLVVAGLLFACEKKEDSTPTLDTSISENDALAESIFNDVTTLSDEAYDIGNTGFKSVDETYIISECATISLDTTTFPRTLNIDFGETNCLCNDGKYRRGKILVSFTGRYRWEGTVITTEFDDYYVNDNKVEGIKVVTNMGENEDGNPYFTISVNGLIYLALDQGQISWNAQKVREWAEGYDTPRVRIDDVYLISGQASGINASGITWDRVITTELRKEIGCRFIVSGTIEIQPEGRPLRILDYGNGECDNIATVTVNGTTYTIFLN